MADNAREIHPFQTFIRGDQHGIRDFAPMRAEAQGGPPKDLSAAESATTPTFEGQMELPFEELEGDLAPVAKGRNQHPSPAPSQQNESPQSPPPIPAPPVPPGATKSGKSAPPAQA